MKTLLTALLAFTLTISCISVTSAQSVQTTSSATIVTTASPARLDQGPAVGSYSFITPSNRKQHSLSADQPITYFNSALGVHEWGTPFLFSSNQGYFVEPAEWFTVPGSPSAAYLDSITLHFTGVSGDTIFVSVFSDQLVQIQGLDGDFHIMNLSGTGTTFARTPIYIGTPVTQPTITQPVDLTIRYPHLAVDPDFHIGVLPRIVNNNGQLTPTSTFVLEGDSEATRARAPETSHSNFLFFNLTNGSLGQALVDSFFTFGSGKPLFSNFNIKAYVSTSASMSGSITVEPSSTIDFGSAQVNETKTATATLQNDGTSSVTITSISSPLQSIFTVTKPALPTTIAAGGSLDLSLGFTPKNTGNKTSSFIITYGDGSSTTISLKGLAAAAGVASSVANNTLALYPNPASSMLEVAGLSSAAQYEVFDVMGRSVLHGSLAPNERVDMSTLLAGQYTVLLKSGATSEAHSIVIAR